MNRPDRTPRTRRFIDRQVQGAIILQMVRHWLLFFLGMLIILTYFQSLFGDPDRSLLGHIQTVLSFHAPLYLVALCLLPAFIHDIIKLSHRFVGPVMRVRRELQRLANGETVAPIQLRKQDFWNGLATDFNAALETIQRNRTTEPSSQSVKLNQREQPHDPQLVKCEV